ncbi:TolB family protein [Rosettibacter firmus]|uniref:TolB family protein n=1 Tax=Rosettibacter firmus TaxID=3111522 RepID=UPI00336BBAA3
MSIQNFIRVSQVILLGLLIFVGCKDNPVSDDGFSVETGPILFISDKSGSYQLYSMNEDGSNVQQLTNDPNFPILDASWSPDGKKIAVVSLVGDESTYPFYRYAIFIMDAYGRNRYQLTQQYVYVDDPVYGKLTYAGALHPVWSPDGKQIAYSRLMVPEAIGNRDIFVINIDGSNELRITSTINFFERIWDWGGKNQAILASAMPWTPYSKILMYTPDGNVLRTWEGDSLGFKCMAYSSKGDKVAYVVDFYPASLAHQDSMFVEDLDSGAIKNITKGTARTYWVVCWSPDDSSILVSVSNRVLILNSDGSDLKDITPFESKVLSPVSWRRR